MRESHTSSKLGTYLVYMLFCLKLFPSCELRLP